MPKTRRVFLLSSPKSRARFSKGNRGVFVKEIIREGVYFHPDHPEWGGLEATPENMQRWVENTARMMAAGIESPILDTHSERAGDIVGHALSYFVALSPGKDGRPMDDSPTKSTYVKCKITDRAYERKIGTTIRRVSLGLAKVTDGQGNKYGECIYHVALTPFPVAHAQETFAPLASGRQGGTFFRPLTKRTRELNMPKQLSQEPSVTRDPRIGSVAVTGELRKAFSKFGLEVGDRAKRSDLEALAEKVLEGAAKTPASIDDAAILAHLSVDVKKQAFAKDFLAQREETNAALVEAATKSGRLTADMAKEVSALLSVKHGFALSKDGAASAVDVTDVVKRLLKAIPENAVVDLSKRIALANGGEAHGRPPNDPEGLTDEKVKKEVERGLSSMPGHRPKK